MKLYKLTDENNQTYGGTLWGPGVTHETSGRGELCGDGWLHAYSHPLLAVLLNPIHAGFKNPRLWEAEGEGTTKQDSQLKLGVTRLTTVKEIPVPQLTTRQRVAFAIRCALTVYSYPYFTRAEKCAAQAAEEAAKANGKKINFIEIAEQTCK